MLQKIQKHQSELTLKPKAPELPVAAAGSHRHHQVRIPWLRCIAETQTVENLVKPCETMWSHEKPQCDWPPHQPHLIFSWVSHMLAEHTASGAVSQAHMPLWMITPKRSRYPCILARLSTTKQRSTVHASLKPGMASCHPCCQHCLTEGLCILCRFG